MCGSYELVPALECNSSLRMPVPKVDERVAGNDPHGGLYRVPRLGTSFHAERLGGISPRLGSRRRRTESITPQPLGDPGLDL